MTTIPELEAWLDAHDIIWRQKSVPVSTIDHLAGLANQARLTTLDEDVVDRYVADMLAGAEFPPVVLNDSGDALVPLGGNHRVAAARRANRTHLDAYVLTDVDTTTAHLLAIEDNRRHGLPLSDDERLHHAVELVRQGAHTLPEAARVCGIATHKLQRQMQVNDAFHRALRLDVATPWQALSTSSKHRLAAVANDRLFARAVDLTAEAVVPAAHVSSLVSRLNQMAFTDAVLHLDGLERNAEGVTRRASGRPSSAPRARFVSDLAGIIAFDPHDIAQDCTSEGHRLQLRAQIKAAARVLMAVDKAIGA